MIALGVNDVYVFRCASWSFNIFPAGGRSNRFHFERSNTDLSVCLLAVEIDDLCQKKPDVLFCLICPHLVVPSLCSTGAGERVQGSLCPILAVGVGTS